MEKSDLSYVYTKKRSEFGKYCLFSDKNAEIIVDIPPSLDTLKDYKLINPLSKSLQISKLISAHEVNTERVLTEIKGVNHVEGGWPKEIDREDIEQVERFRKKIEREEAYQSSVVKIAGLMEKYIKQNNALDIYEMYFENETDFIHQDPPSAHMLCTLKDPYENKRSIMNISWCPDGQNRIAGSYCFSEFQEIQVDKALDSYVWNLENLNRPEYFFNVGTPLVYLEFNPKDSHMLVGGCYNGQIAFFDTRKGSNATYTSCLSESHKDPVWNVQWIQSKTATQCFSTSTDGQVLTWDLRKLSSPLERIILDPTKTDNPDLAQGSYCLEYEPTIPTRFMVGTEQGLILQMNRKGKSSAEKFSNVFQAHFGPIYSLTRNNFFPKQYMSVGDWSYKIWSEDIKESPIMWSYNYSCQLSGGCWSPVRPSVFYISRTDGILDIWDYAAKQDKPTLSLKVFEEPIQSLKSNDNGKIIACGSKRGQLTLVKVSNSFTMMVKNEKNVFNSMIEREIKREKILENRNKEIKLKEKFMTGNVNQELNDLDARPKFNLQSKEEELDQLSAEFYAKCEERQETIRGLFDSAKIEINDIMDENF